MKSRSRPIPPTVRPAWIFGPVPISQLLSSPGLDFLAVEDARVPHLVPGKRAPIVLQFLARVLAVCPFYQVGSTVGIEILEFFSALVFECRSEVPEVQFAQFLEGGVCEFPMRVKCATLAWHTLTAALKDRDETVTTE